jgi:general secretion pathway protein A
MVLLIDEAQNLPTKVLEEVRMLSNLETEKDKLIQIILIGQPQLKTKLEHVKLEQFKQRIAVFYHLNSLNQAETREYIHYRLKLVSPNTENIFSPDAISQIYAHSKGIPRIINITCDSALLSGYVLNTKIITPEIIAEVIKERNFDRKLAGGLEVDIPESV